MEPLTRIRAKGWFLTYPKCEVSPQSALEYLKAKDTIHEYVIAQEEHQDGSHHLHAFIKTDRVTWTPDRFDLPEHHGNYQVAKSWKAVQRYVTKGGNFISSIDTESALSKQSKKNLALASMSPKQAVEEGYISLMALPKFVLAQNMFKAL